MKALAVGNAETIIAIAFSRRIELVIELSFLPEDP
jgi:hypothetical protein